MRTQSPHADAHLKAANAAGGHGLLPPGVTLYIRQSPLRVCLGGPCRARLGVQEGSALPRGGCRLVCLPHCPLHLAQLLTKRRQLGSGCRLRRLLAAARRSCLVLRLLKLLLSGQLGLLQVLRGDIHNTGVEVDTYLTVLGTTCTRSIHTR